MTEVKGHVERVYWSWSVVVSKVSKNNRVDVFPDVETEFWSLDLYFGTYIRLRIKK